MDAQRVADNSSRTCVMHLLPGHVPGAVPLSRRAVLAVIAIAIPLTTPWLLAFAMRPSIIRRHLDTQVVQARQVDPVLGKTGVNVTFGGSEVAGDTGSIFGPRASRHHVLPCLQDIVKICHAERLPYVPGAVAQLWTAGPLGVSLADGCGDERHGAGMELAEVFGRFASLAMWSGVLCWITLLAIAPGQVMAEETLSMGGACPGGGLSPDAPATTVNTHPPPDLRPTPCEIGRRPPEGGAT